MVLQNARLIYIFDMHVPFFSFFNTLVFGLKCWLDNPGQKGKCRPRPPRGLLALYLTPLHARTNEGSPGFMNIIGVGTW